VTDRIERLARVRNAIFMLSRHRSGVAPLPAARVAELAGALEEDLRTIAEHDRERIEVDAMLLASVVGDLACFYRAQAEGEAHG
jgi:hypothetical protein